MYKRVMLVYLSLVTLTAGAQCNTQEIITEKRSSYSHIKRIEGEIRSNCVGSIEKFTMEHVHKLMVLHNEIDCFVELKGKLPIAFDQGKINSTEFEYISKWVNFRGDKNIGRSCDSIQILTNKCNKFMNTIVDISITDDQWLIIQKKGSAWQSLLSQKVEERIKLLEIHNSLVKFTLIEIGKDFGKLAELRLQQLSEIKNSVNNNLNNLSKVKSDKMRVEICHMLHDSIKKGLSWQIELNGNLKNISSSTKNLITKFTPLDLNQLVRETKKDYSIGYFIRYHLYTSEWYIPKIAVLLTIFASTMVALKPFIMKLTCCAESEV